MTKTHKAHFTVTGEFITNFVRDRLVESGWQNSLRILMDCVDGINYDIAIQILKGEKRFVGDNEPSLEDELTEVKEAWEKRLQWLFAGTVFDAQNQIYWKPYAYVTSWGEHDLVDHENRFHPRTERLHDKNAWGENRSCHYMDDPSNDRIFSLRYKGEEVSVLWKEAKALPVWMNQQSYKWQEALDDYCKVHGNNLEERGNSESYPYDYPKEETYTENTETSILDEIAERAAEETGLPIETLKGTALAISDKQDWTSKPIPTEDYTKQCGYIAPDGKFYDCLFHNHKPLAARLLLHICGISDEDGIDPEIAAEKRGFMRISGGVSRSVGTIPTRSMKDKQPTPDQITTLELWCAVNKCKMPEWANEFSIKEEE